MSKIKKEKIATTSYIPNQRGYILPTEIIFPKIKVEVFNKKKNKWDIGDYHFEMVLDRKKKKTDETIKIYY